MYFNGLLRSYAVTSFRMLPSKPRSQKAKWGRESENGPTATMFFPSCGGPRGDNVVLSEHPEDHHGQCRKHALNVASEFSSGSLWSDFSAPAGATATPRKVSAGIAAATQILRTHGRQFALQHYYYTNRTPHDKSKIAGGSKCDEITTAPPHTNVSLPLRDFPLSSASVSSSAAVSNSFSYLFHSTSYEPFERLWHRYLERGFTEPMELLSHPDAPPPAVLLARTLQHRPPSERLLCQSLLAMLQEPSRTIPKDSDVALAALRQTARCLRTACPTLYALPWVKTLMLEVLLCARCYVEAKTWFNDLTDCEMTPRLWRVMVDAASQGALPDSELLDRILALRSQAESPCEDSAKPESSNSSTSATKSNTNNGVGVKKTTHDAFLVLTQIGRLVRPSSSMVTGNGAISCPFDMQVSRSTLLQEITMQERGEGGVSGSFGRMFELPRGVFEVRPSTMFRVPARAFPSTATRSPSRVSSETHSKKLLSQEGYSSRSNREQGTEFDLIALQQETEGESRHWCVLSPAEVAYALVHYSKLESAVVGDERAALTSSTSGVLLLYPHFDACVKSFQAEATNKGETSKQEREEGTTSRRRLEQEATAVTLRSRGIIYGISSETAARLMLRAGLLFGGHASPTLALNILRRYVRGCRLLHQEAVSLRADYAQELSTLRLCSPVAHPSTSSAVAVLGKGKMKTGKDEKADAITGLDPKPFLAFFHLLREARDVLRTTVTAAVAASGAGPFWTDSATTKSQSDGCAGLSLPLTGNLGLPMMHWKLAWHYFQLLNREHAMWYVNFPQDAPELCLAVLELLTRGADPRMSLNLSNWAAARGILDSVEVALWLLHHLDPSHHTKETQEVTRKLFRWLLVDVGLHLHARLHTHLLSIARVLIRVKMQEELTALYNAVLDNAYAFSEDFRSSFCRIVMDLVCPACSSILSSQRVFEERTCGNCLAVIPAKPVEQAPSFELTEAHAQWARKRRQEVRLRVRRQILARQYEQPQPRLRSHPREDAVVLFQRKLLNESKQTVDGAGSESQLLLPGVSLSSTVQLFPHSFDRLEAAQQRGGAVLSNFDLAAAVEESTRRLAGQRIGGRGAGLPERDFTSSSSVQAALPSSSCVSFAPSFLGVPPREASLAPSSSHTPWVCVWCQERNSPWLAEQQRECGTCGAETGPAAAWRRFVPAGTGDVMVRLRECLAAATETETRASKPTQNETKDSSNASAAVLAGYVLMLYRRTFCLRARPADRTQLHRLVEVLCDHRERVLAAFLYTRLIPSAARCKTDLALSRLAQLFGTNAALAGVADDSILKNDETFFPLVFTKATCRVCFGTHDWQQCPIITRDFSASARARINLSPREKEQLEFAQLQQALASAVEKGDGETTLSAERMVQAYTRFVTSPVREAFAQAHPTLTNQLSIGLSYFHQYRRAALVLCHVPPSLRSKEAYRRFLHYFNVTEDDAEVLWAQTTPSEGKSVLNFVQITRTCCVCLDQPHASHSCPSFTRWLVAAEAGKAGTRDEITQQVRLRAQVGGWVNAGPERLHALYRFLLDHVDTFAGKGTVALRLFAMKNKSSVALCGEAQPMNDFEHPFLFAVNLCIRKLASTGLVNQASRLYARVSPRWVSSSTTASLLRANHFSEEAIAALLPSSSSSSSSSCSPSSLFSPGVTKETNWMDSMEQKALTARKAAVSLSDCCLICFDRTHVFWECSELNGQITTPLSKLQYILTHVGGIRVAVEGIQAAASYTHLLYQEGFFVGDSLGAAGALMMRDLLALATRCFAAHQLRAGVRLLRHIPLELVLPTKEQDEGEGECVYVLFWRAAGLSDTQIASKTAALEELMDAEGIDVIATVPPAGGVRDGKNEFVVPRRVYARRFLDRLHSILYDGLCSYCFAHDHTFEKCPLFQSEVGFGRDYVAAYRMSLISEQLDQDWQDAYLLKLVDFFHAHRLTMPFHIVGVTNALNAITSMWSFRGEPGIALKHLLRIPPAYRGRQAFRHILTALQVPQEEVARALASFHFPREEEPYEPDEQTSTNHTENRHALNPQRETNNSKSVFALGPRHPLLLWRLPIRDVAMRMVFSKFPAATAALAQADERMASIRRRNEVSTSFPATDAASSLPFNPSSLSHPAGTLSGSLGQPSNHASSSSLGTSSHAPRSSFRPQQSGCVTRLREDFDPVLQELEDAVGMKLGTRHVLFASAIEPASAGRSGTEERQPLLDETEHKTTPSLCVMSSSSSTSGIAASSLSQLSPSRATSSRTTWPRSEGGKKPTLPSPTSRSNQNTGERERTNFKKSSPSPAPPPAFSSLSFPMSNANAPEDFLKGVTKPKITTSSSPRAQTSARFFSNTNGQQSRGGGRAGGGAGASNTGQPSRRPATTSFVPNQSKPRASSETRTKRNT